MKLVDNYRIGPIFTPPVVSVWPKPLGTLILPAATGGANWEGGSLDPATNIMYIFSNTAPTNLGMVPGGERSDMAYIGGTARNPNAPPPAGRAGGAPGSAPAPEGGQAAGRGAAPGQAPAGGRGAAPAGGGGGEGGAALTVQGLPIVKPPYGRITALDLNKGELVWQIAHGETPDNIKNHPALKGVTIPRTGRQGRIGVLTTKTLVIAGEGGFFTAPNGQRGAMLRAYDKATGKEVGAVYMPAPQTGSPMTYMMNGKQYITVSISGPGYSGEVVAFRLGS
jgi:quinoprotein glucose dehydrogenase